MHVCIYMHIYVYLCAYSLFPFSWCIRNQASTGENAFYVNSLIIILPLLSFRSSPLLLLLCMVIFFFF